VSSAPALVYQAGQPDGWSIQGTLDQPPSILDPAGEDGPDDSLGVDDDSVTDPVFWCIDVLSDRPGPTTGPPRVGSDAVLTTEPPSPAASPYAPEATPAPFFPGALQEATGTHATRISAQALPEVGDTVLDGQWSPGDTLDLYRISMHPNTQALRVGLHVLDPRAGSPDHLVLYDGQGKVLGDQPLPLSQAGVNLLLRALGQRSQAQTIYVGIYSSKARSATSDSDGSAEGTGSSDTPDSAVPYELDVSLIPNLPSGSSGGDAQSSAPRGDSPASSMPVEPAQGGSGSGRPAGASVSAAPASLSTSPPSLTLTQAVGPPQLGGSSGGRLSPYRSVEPLGGALSARTTTRGVDHRAGAYVDFDLLPVLEDAEGAPVPEETAGNAQPVVEPAPSNGGLPVLGAAMPAVRNAETAGKAVSAHPPQISSAAVLGALAEQAKARNAEEARSAEAISAVSDSTRTSRPPMDRPRSLALLRTGIGLAYMLAFTYLLPDMTAAFQASGGRKRRAIRWGSFRRWPWRR
jgi:hypothetical protein